MQTGPEENFAGVDVANASDVSLVKEEILETPFPLKEGKEFRERELPGEGIYTEFLLKHPPLIEKGDFPELPGVDEKETRSRGEDETRPFVPHWQVFLFNPEPPGHPKVNGKNPSFAERENEVLPKALQGMDSLPLNLRFWEYKKRISKANLANSLSRKNWLKLSPENLNLWKLWHTSIVPYLTATTATP